jgi:hypothetical protein
MPGSRRPGGRTIRAFPGSGLASRTRRPAFGDRRPATGPAAQVSDSCETRAVAHTSTWTARAARLSGQFPLKSMSMEYRSPISETASGVSSPPSSSRSRNACSKPPGEMISRMRAGVSPAFQNVCHWPRALKMRTPAAPKTSSSPSSAPTVPSRMKLYSKDRKSKDGFGADSGPRPV